VDPSPGSWLIGAGLSAIRAAAAQIKRVLLYLLARLLTGDALADAYPAAIAAAGMLDLVVVWCCGEGIAGWRYSVLVHSASLFLWAVPPGCFLTRGGVSVSTGIVS
jgi:hypothetical protein